MPTLTIRSPIAPDGHDDVAVTAEVPELPTLSMLGSDGLVLSRQPWADHTDEAPGEVAAPVGLLLHRSRLVRTALTLAEHHPRVGPIVIWPQGVPLDLATLALATATVLHTHRRAGAPPPVICPIRPPMRHARIAIRHQVRAEPDSDPDAEWIVWEPVPRHPTTATSAAA